ncbi:MAG: N4-gp56 family major capsid protein [Oscillospiraceae bacterium]|nr:N4-gp56 family major capsid protein [Oscillospiraceae bacterium]
MAGGMNLATKYASQVDERFYRESQAMVALNSDYKFTGEKTVKVYSIPIVAMNDYVRSGASRYGSPSDLSRNVQSLTITRDRAFTFIIDKGDKLQSEMVSDAGKALSRQIREVVVPEFDTYVFKTLADAAIAAGNTDSTAVTKSNAYEMFLQGMEHMGNKSVPDKGRVAFCTYRFANLLMQDPAFIKYADRSQEMVVKGIMGEVDGCRIVKVPSSHLPRGAAFLITHSIAATGPKQLEEYKVHDDPPGISGWLVEGRFIYDCFVLNEKADAIYYHGGQQVIKDLALVTAATDSGKSTVVVNGLKEASANKWYYVTAATAAALTAVTYNTAITVANWTELTANGTELTPTAGHKFIRVVEVDASSKPVAVGDAPLNIG